LKADALLQLGRGRQRVYWPLEVCYPLQDWVNLDSGKGSADTMREFHPKFSNN
jgi:hypothetical protein